LLQHGGLESFMFNPLFDKLRRKKNPSQIPQREIVSDETEPNKYLDTECNLYRYSKFIHHLDKNDELYEFIEGFHTIPVHEEIDFEEAASKSISFNANHESYKKKLLRHQLMKNPQRGTRGSTYEYMFEDGSLLTSLRHYRDNAE
jgi:hypothetical protein